jgi:hypothetical protein
MPSNKDSHLSLKVNDRFPTFEGWRFVSLIGLTTMTLSPIACTIEPTSSVDYTRPQLKHRDFEGSISSDKTQLTRALSPQSLTRLKDEIVNKKQPSIINVEVEKLLVAREVKKRRAIGEAIRFPSNIGAIWSFAQVYAQGGTAQLEIRWWRGQTKVSVSPFLVAEGLRWREWSKVTIKPNENGQWKVEVFDPTQQKVLASHTFQIDSPTPTKKDVLDHQKTVVKSQTLSIKSSSTPTLHDSAVQLTDQETNQSFSVNRFEIARKIKRRRPVGVGNRFSIEDERLWGYIEVSNPEAPNFVWMEWYQGEELRSRLKVRVGVSKRWRTWSWQRLSQRDEGQWSVKVLSDAGDLLSQTQFIVTK